MAKKSWSELSPAYRARLERSGITPAMHSRGEGIQKARGHAKDAIITEFRRNKGKRYVKDFEKLPRNQQVWLADWFNQGFMKSGPVTQEDRDKRNAFLGWKLLNHDKFDIEDWEQFRKDYTAKFSKS
jgi:hypothetical protein